MDSSEVTASISSDTRNGVKNDDSCSLSTRPLPRSHGLSHSCDVNLPDTSSILAAGLPSELSTRQFADRCNRVFHNRAKNAPRPVQPTTYEEPNAFIGTKHRHFRYGDTVAPLPPGSVAVTAAATTLQSKIRNQYIRYNRINTFRQPEGRLTDTSAPKTEREANRLRNLRHCRIFFDTSEDGQCPESCLKQQPLSHYTEDSPRPPTTITTERTVIGGTRTIFSQDAGWQIVSMRMSCIDPSISEREIEDMARQSDIHIVSLDLDRNIISHLCNGTGTITCRHTGGESGLLRFSQILAKRGIRLYITDLISQPELKRSRPSK
ncbi:anti-sigma factor, putative [Babesia ovis]|uniref:Anti-sigma factor, putative n=1 Tax=Babesia ovis TaxID=5869 RepID=A0A9W5T8Z9_BABOV|nr:anti-sigma factor, putative [Babesia ovis]